VSRAQDKVNDLTRLAQDLRAKAREAQYDAEMSNGGALAVSRAYRIAAQMVDAVNVDAIAQALEEIPNIDLTSDANPIR
jgi:F0F1-type ATP synthase assembly protein I